MSEDSKGAWAVVGKVAVIIGIILGCIQIFKYVSTDGPVLRAQGSLHPVHYSPRALERDKVEPQTIDLYLPYDLKDHEAVAKKVAEDINSNLIYRDSELQTLSQNTVAEINISNNGNREAQDVTIEFPTSGFYALERVGEATKKDNFDRIIKVGNIRSNNTTSLLVWPKSFSEYQEDKVKVTHTLGATDIDFAMAINGWSALPFHWPMGTVLILILLTLLAYGFGASAQKKTVTSNEPTKKDEEPSSDKVETETKTPD